MAAKANGSAPGPIIRVSNVRKTFREGASRTDALKDVSFDIMPGEFCTIIGRSGSGKSTLLNMLAGLDHPTRGQIVILGRHIERMSEDELVAFRLRHVGFVFQSYNLFPSYDALENVAMPLTYRGVPRRVREKRARRMIQSVGLKHRMHHTPNKMSGGEQQRVGIARALITNPQIIFADEPTGNLDVKTSARALKLMVDCVRERGATLIVVTHDPEMSRYADHVIRLLDGCVIENTLNPSPDEIQPPEDSGQDWEPVAAQRPQPGTRHQGWLARRRAAKQAARDAAAEAAQGEVGTHTDGPAAGSAPAEAAKAEDATQGGPTVDSAPAEAAKAEAAAQSGATAGSASAEAAKAEDTAQGGATAGSAPAEAAKAEAAAQGGATADSAPAEAAKAEAAAQGGATADSAPAEAAKAEAAAQGGATADSAPAEAAKAEDTAQGGTAAGSAPAEAAKAEAAAQGGAAAVGMESAQGKERDVEIAP